MKSKMHRSVVDINKYRSEGIKLLEGVKKVYMGVEKRK